MRAIDEPAARAIERAREAAKQAYCPYSRFPVGAAVETESGWFAGCNVENASYGLTICAERVAIASAIAAGAKRFLRIAVSCSGVDVPDRTAETMPCGACRQVIAEFLPPDADVIVDGTGVWCVQELLPVPFSLNNGCDSTR